MGKLKKCFAEGGCTCRAIHYGLMTRPLYVHCCHCTWCQRESGSAFAINVLIETNRVQLRSGAVELVATPSASGKGQSIARCPACKIALWSHYAGAGKKIAFVRGGTLDNPNLCPPDIHIFTSTKQDWVVLPKTANVVRGYYTASAHWPDASLARRAAISGT